ncbi:ABC transporter [Aliarcobacter trophiarum LMG 25534]|uniref:ABC transporter n=1 Tax=Aliarcobacter trophiarum LMG 25534 TaxID=1032241 RepID=A0AAD0QLR7_9BACT|nr:VacJ family lipoprotein [Aliarcobacter trophiarum]AXK49025.1 lipid asymmetry ABC transporter MlaABCDEF, lipoprotein MlaA [Aliarcobacter trophiarum LMG 25534]RXI27334.1 ABC transporter [Aliarcobacter trophiarum]RXJ89892.1 ABC transporter [Aliarcobacter trophiarum LMG 25534]
MKNIIFIMLFSAFSFANEGNFPEDIESEFKPTNSVVFDPLSGYNRVMTSFNDGFITYVLSPTAKGYAYVVPEVARTGINNFFINLFFPVRFVNNLLQLKFERAGKEMGRFLVNTIWGFGGFMDQATNTLGMERYKEDFGQTLGYWGVGEGFHVVLPFLGPSNLRDIVGITGDLILAPTSQLAHNVLPYKIPQNDLQAIGMDTLYIVNDYSFHPDMYEIVKKDAIDLYPYLRDAYNQKREKEIEE